MALSNSSGKNCAKTTSSFQYAINESLSIRVMFDPEVMIDAVFDNSCQLPGDFFAKLAQPAGYSRLFDAS
jgi:hypothetical protein